MENSLWWNGNEFLRNPDSKWPKSPEVQAVTRNFTAVIDPKKQLTDEIASHFI